MGGRRVPQAMRTDADLSLYYPPGCSRIKAPASRADEQGRTRLKSDQRWPASLPPAIDGADSRNPDRYDPLLGALAKYPYRPAGLVDVVDVEPAQLADPDPGGVEQLHDRPVAQVNRIRTAAVSGRGEVKYGDNLVNRQDIWELTLSLGAA